MVDPPTVQRYHAAFTRSPEIVFAWAEGASHDGLEPPPDPVWATVRRELGRLVACPAAVLLEGFDRTLCAEDVVERVDRLRAWGVIALLLPEVDGLYGFHATCALHHKDLWAHTAAVVAKLPADADLRWAALMHDAGKIGTRHSGPGAVSFLRHEAVGAYLMRGVAARLEMPAARAERIAFVIAHHGRANAYEPAWTERALRRLIRDAGPRLDDLIAFSSADYTTKQTKKAGRIRANLADLRARIGQLQAPAAPRLPTGLGAQISADLGVHGPALGELMRWLADEVAARRLPADAAPAVYVDAARDYEATRVKTGRES